jgi:hypothetical protein
MQGEKIARMVVKGFDEGSAAEQSGLKVREMHPDT